MGNSRRPWVILNIAIRSPRGRDRVRGIGLITGHPGKFDWHLNESTAGEVTEEVGNRLKG